MLRSFSIAALALLTAAPGLVAAPVPTGPEVQVNEFTTGRQVNPVVAALPNGSVVVAWEDQQTGEDRRVFARIIDAAGQPNGGEFQVSVGTTDDRTSPAVATLPSGDFLVAWENSTDDGQFVSSRHYDANGQASPVVTLQDPEDSVDIFDPKIVAADAGHFMVAWEAYDGVPNESSFRARRVDAAGAPAGVVLTLESAIANDFVGSLSLGERVGDGFVAAWELDANTSDALVRTYDFDGAPDGAALTVSTGNPRSPQAAGLADDGFLVVWGDSASGLQRQRFLGDGGSGPLLDVTATDQTQGGAVLTALPGDRGALTWFQNGGGASEPQRVMLQVIDSDDTATDIEVDASDATVFHPGITYDATGGTLIVVWTRRGGAGTDQEEIILRRYALDILFGDGFESGDTSSWAETIGGL